MTAQVGTGTLAEGASGWLGRLAQYRAVWSSPDFITSAATILLIAAAWLTSLAGIGIGVPVDDASWLARLAGSETDWLAPALGLAGVVIGGAKIAVGAVRGLLERELNVDELVTIAIVAAVILGEYLSAGLVAFMMLFGKVLEDFTAERAEIALEGLGALLPATARRKSEQDTEEEEEVPLAALRQGDIVIIRPGERIPIDGVVMAGQAAVDQAALTGEPVPQPRGPGDEVLAGGLAHQGALEVRTTRIGAATAIGRIRQLVAAAEEERAPVVRRGRLLREVLHPGGAGTGCRGVAVHLSHHGRLGLAAGGHGAGSRVPLRAGAGHADCRDRRCGQRRPARSAHQERCPAGDCGPRHRGCLRQDRHSHPWSADGGTHYRAR